LAQTAYSKLVVSRDTGRFESLECLVQSSIGRGLGGTLAMVDSGQQQCSILVQFQIQEILLNIDGMT
jgi:hypothetical protein